MMFFKHRTKWGLIVGTLGLLIIAGFVFAGKIVNHGSQSTQIKTHQLRKNHIHKYQPLTLKAFKSHRDLAFCSVIYFAIKHVKIQRWQEVSDFNLGWQIEIHRTSQGAHYLVWPDKRITAKEKQLEPNWFELKENGRVIYHSFVVHSFRKNLTQTATVRKVINQINSDRAAGRVRGMQKNLVIRNDN
ncbi:hypothetical protein ACFQ22_11845 [Lentilactobacillus raoultii]|uniref:Uncharacterized protein n=1 Tax=Lentilactobacillus raoultii TaxID=1987503 RepID=A0ABW3PLY0_9LACO|nr:hypothetical protein [Lentilactobacillus raoultii]